MALMSMSRRYRVRPSELLNISDEYTAYCLDEVCAYLMARVDNGEEMHFTKKYSSFTDIYKDYE